MKKTVWIINHYAFTPSQGGPSRHYFFTRNLIARGYNVRVFTSSAIHNSDINMIDPSDKSLFKEVEMDGVIYTYIKSGAYKGNGVKRVMNMLTFSRRIMKIWQHFKQEKPDVIYASSPDIFTALKAQKLAKKHNVPVVTEIRDLWPLSIVEYRGLSNSNPLIKVLYGREKKLYKSTDALVFTMPGGGQYVKDRGLDKVVPEQKIFNINNGVDLKEQAYQRENCVLQDGDLQDGTFKVIYAGSIRYVNSVDLLIKATALLKDKPIKFLIYGDGNDKAELEKYCADNGLDSVIFKGRVDKKYIPYICSRANINFISVKQTGVSKYGVSWNKLFDYMSAGKPIISNVKVNYDLIEKFGCGISLEEQTPEKIAESILKIYNLPEAEYNKMCEGAKEGVRDFDFEILTDKLEKVLNYAIDSKKA